MSDVSDLTKSQRKVKQGSASSFGYLVGAVATLYALAPLASGNGARVPILILGAALIVLGRFYPVVLSPFNKIWLKLGRLLEKIVGPVILTILFFVFFSPLALLLRLLKGRSLAFGFDPNAKSYWQDRPSHLKESNHFKNQF